MRKTRSLCKVLSLLCTLTLLFSSIPFTVHADGDTSNVRVVYVSSTGSDGNDGSKNAPFASYNAAVLALCSGTRAQNGGTVVVMDDINPDASSESDTANYLANRGLENAYHDGLLTFTGKDPIDGTIYPAVFRYAYWGMHGPTKFEYLCFAPNRANFRVNACGYPTIFGDGNTLLPAPSYITNTTGWGVHLHDGVGETTGSTTVSSTDTTIESGDFGAMYIGGGYVTNPAHGVTGNCRFTMNGGTVNRLLVGYDYYSDAHTTGTIGGNVTIELSGNATVNSIALTQMYRNNGFVSSLTGGKLGGALTIISYGNATYNQGTLPEAAGGVWQIKGGKHGKIQATDTVGTFQITADYGFTAYIDGNACPNGLYALPQGTTYVSFTCTSSDKAYANTLPDGSFEPDAPLTRADGVSMLYDLAVGLPKADDCPFTDIVITDRYYESASTLASIDALPSDWGNTFQPHKALTRAELVYIAENLFSSQVSAHKLFDFSDVSESHRYYRVITDAAASGKISGYADGSFCPDKAITRAEAVTIINRYAQRTPLSSADDFADVTPSHWAYKQIAAAATDLSEGHWSKVTGNRFSLPEGSTSESAVKSLYNNSYWLSGEEIRDGIDQVAEQMKKNVLETGNTQELYPERFTSGMTVYYISEQNGNDTNNGLSPQTPLKTIQGLKGKQSGITYNSVTDKISLNNTVSNVAILFERGGIYRGSFTLETGGQNQLLGAYGDSSKPKPLILQSRRNYADPDLWEAVDGYPNLWKCTEELINVGVIGFDHDLFDYSQDTYNELYGQMMNIGVLGFTGSLSELNEDLQFYSVVTNDNELGSPSALYLYSTGGNPGSRFQSIEIGENVTTIGAARTTDVLIDNLAFKFTGGHAIGGGFVTNRIVTNCVFSWLGGSVLGFYPVDGTVVAVNYGNAVEVFGGCDGYRVENCWMYQIYDTAVTHQYTPTTECVQKNVRYYGLLMEYCHWGIEYYNYGNSDSTSTTKYTRDVHMAYNVCRTGGMGWGSLTRQRLGQLYCCAGLSYNEDELTEYNIFDRCHGQLLTLPANAAEVDDKNIYVQTLGEPVGRLKNNDYTNSVCTMRSHRDIRDLLGDENAVFVAVDPE